MVKVLIGSDHRGFHLKDQIKAWLKLNEYYVTDLGAPAYDPGDDYGPVSLNLAQKVVAEKARGIIICRSGIGVAVAANKVVGARAGLCTSQKQVFLARNDDDINILALSADLVPAEENIIIVSTFLNTPFSADERHLRRLKIIYEFETSQLCPA